MHRRILNLKGSKLYQALNKYLDEAIGDKENSN